MKRLVGVAAIAVLAACSNEPNKDLYDKLGSTYEMEGKEVELEGFICFRPFAPRLNGDRATGGTLCNARSTMRRVVAVAHNLSFAYARTNNSVWFPQPFDREAFEVYDVNGARFGPDEPVTVTGTVRYLAKGPKGKPSSDSPAATGRVKLKMPDMHPQKDPGDGNDYSFAIEVTKITKN